MTEQGWRDILKRKAQTVQRVLQGPDGDAFIEMLEDTFQTKIYDADPGRMAYNAGQFELVQYIKQLRSSTYE